MSDPVLAGGTVADPPLGGALTDPALGGDIGAPQGVAGPPGRDGKDGGSRTYAFAFSAPALAWSIAHGLGRFPSVTIVDTAGDQASADVAYLDENTIAVRFGFPTAGAAYLN